MATPAATTTAKQGNTTAAKPKIDAAQIRALTEKLAYEMWEKRGRKHGNDQQDWIEAEKLARQKLGI
jgi:hypothetical protein